MTGWRRAGGWTIAIAIALLLGWQIVATAVADHLATSHPRVALRWNAGNPPALAALARARLHAQQPADASRIARELLRRAPLQADAFAILAAAAHQQGQESRAHALYAIAARRAPRNANARAQAIAGALRAGRWDEAMHDLDVLLRISPQRVAPMVPVLAKLAANPGFADALARTLATRPPWRGSMLDALYQHADPGAVDRVMAALQADGGFDAGDFPRWLAWLGAKGRWGEAYGLWAGRVHLAGARLPLVYNGDFAHAPSGAPFDWDMRGEPGVLVERVAGAAAGDVARVTFLDRRADAIHFGQVLLLAPGTYRLDFRARARALRSASGLTWTVACIGGGAPLAASAPLQGSFGWTTLAVDFTVPASGCDAQRLTLANPGPGGAGKIVSGALWVDDFTIAPARGVASNATAATRPGT